MAAMKQATDLFVKDLSRSANNAPVVSVAPPVSVSPPPVLNASNGGAVKDLPAANASAAPSVDTAAVSSSSSTTHHRRRHRRRHGSKDSGSTAGGNDDDAASSSEDEDDSAHYDYIVLVPDANLASVQTTATVARPAVLSAPVVSSAQPAAVAPVANDAKERIAKLQKEAQDLVAAMIEKDEALAKLRSQHDELDRQLGTLRQEHGALREQYNIVCQKTGSVDATVSAQRQQIATLTASLRAAETALAGQQHKAEHMMAQFLAAEHAARNSLETSALAQSALLDSLERRHVEISERELVVRSRDRDMSARERELVRKELAAQKLDAELREKQTQLDKQTREMAEFADAFVRQKIDAAKSKPPPPVERPPPLIGGGSEPSSPKVLSPLASPRDELPLRAASARRSHEPSAADASAASTTTSPPGVARTASNRGRPLPTPSGRRDRSPSVQDRIMQLRILYRVADGKVHSMASDSAGYAEAQAELKQIVAELAELGASPVDLERKGSGRQLPQLPKKDVDLSGTRAPPVQQQRPTATPMSVGTIASGRSAVVPPSKVPSDRLSTAISALPHDDDEHEDGGGGGGDAGGVVEESWKEVEEKEEAAVAAKTDWYVCFTDEGDEYYYNPSTDETSWELPPGAHRTLMNLWDAPSNPNDMNVEEGGDGDDGAAASAQAAGAAAASGAASSVAVTAGPELQRRLTQLMDDVPRIIKCQSYVRGMLARRVSLPAARKEHAKNRKAIMREIVNTESAYVGHLKTLVDLYWGELSKLCESGQLGDVTAADLADIFPPSTREIMRIAETLLATLNDQLANAKSVDDLSFGRIFSDLAPKLSEYSRYVNDCSKSIERWTELLANDTFHAALAEIKQRSGSKWDLSMFLIVPVQRVPRYELLLKELLKATLPSNQDYRSMQLAYQLIQHVNARINKDKKAAEDRREVADVLGRIAKLPDGPLHSFRVVKQGELLSSSFAADKEKKGHGSRRYANKSQFFLFNDSLIRCKRRNLVVDKRRFEFKERFPLSSAFTIQSMSAGGGGGGGTGSAASSAAAASAATGGGGASNSPTGAAHAAELEECGFVLATVHGVVVRRFWAANEAERAEWESAIRACLTPGAPSDADDNDTGAGFTHDLRGVEARIEVVRDQIAKSRTKPQRDAAIQELRVLEAERATLVLKADGGAGAPAMLGRGGVAGTTGRMPASSRAAPRIGVDAPTRTASSGPAPAAPPAVKVPAARLPPAAMAQLQDRLARDKAAGGGAPASHGAQSGAWETIKPTGLLRTNRVAGELAHNAKRLSKGMNYGALPPELHDDVPDTALPSAPTTTAAAAERAESLHYIELPIEPMLGSKLQYGALPPEPTAKLATAAAAIAVRRSAHGNDDEDTRNEPLPKVPPKD
jgi:hypothetical protein